MPQLAATAWRAGHAPLEARDTSPSFLGRLTPLDGCVETGPNGFSLFVFKSTDLKPEIFPLYLPNPLIVHKGRKEKTKKRPRQLSVTGVKHGWWPFHTKRECAYALWDYRGH